MSCTVTALSMPRSLAHYASDKASLTTLYVQHSEMLSAHLKTLKGMPVSYTQSARAWSTPTLLAACMLSWMGICLSPELSAFSVSLAILRFLLLGRAWTRASISSQTSHSSLVSDKVHPFTSPGLHFKCSWILPGSPEKL